MRSVSYNEKHTPGGAAGRRSWTGEQEFRLPEDGNPAEKPERFSGVNRMNREYYNSNEDFLERMWRNPKNVLNLIIIAVNVLVFVMVTVTGGSDDAENMIRWGAAYTPLIHQGEYYRLFTSMFLHFGPEHLLNNMFLLLFAGDYLEKSVGKLSYLAVYLLGGMTGSISSYLFEYSNGRAVIAAGASGAIFAVLGAIIVLLILNRGKLEDLTMIRVGLMILLTLMAGFQSGNVDNYAHIGGFVGGMIVMMLFSPLYLRRKQKKR